MSVVDGVVNVGALNGVMAYEVGNTNWLNNETSDTGKYANLISLHQQLSISWRSS